MLRVLTFSCLFSLALATACFGQEKTSPVKLDCTFYGNVDFKKLNFRGFSNTKVAPENIVFWRPDSLPRNDKPHYPTFWELGRGFGHITGVVDWRGDWPYVAIASIRTCCKRCCLSNLG